MTIQPNPFLKIEMMDLENCFLLGKNQYLQKPADGKKLMYCVRYPLNEAVILKVSPFVSSD
jgi:hypothetical protein